MWESGRGVGGRGYSFVACLSLLAFDHAAPFLFLIETPPTFGRSVRFFHILHRICLLILSPPSFTVCGYHLSPRIAIVFSQLSSLPNSSTSHASNFLISSNASRSSLYISHSPDF